ncbi:MAG: LamG-like jellyroll fold domain-containing protein [Bacteroidales bacterium]
MKRKSPIFLSLIFFIFQFTFEIALGQPCIPNTNSVDFNGSSSFVRINTMNGLDVTNQLTIEAWIYPKAFASGSAGNSIFCKHAWGTSMYGYVLRCGGSGQLSFNIAGAVGGSPVGWKEVLSPLGALSLNTWQHVAATFDGSVLTLYVNGAVSGSFGFAGTIYPSIGYKARIGALADTVWSMSRYFNGMIDEVRVWNRALSPMEITSGMNDHIDPVVQTGLIGYWRFNEGSGSFVGDLGDGNNNASMVGGTWSGQVPFNNTSLPAPVISWVAPNLVSSYTTGNQWYFGTTLIPGATQQTYTPTQYGNYKVEVSDTNGCTGVSLPFNFNTTGIQDELFYRISVLPNPAGERITVSLLSTAGTLECYLYSADGRILKNKCINNASLLELPVSDLAPGVYFLTVLANGNYFSRKILIER